MRRFTDQEHHSCKLSCIYKYLSYFTQRRSSDLELQKAMSSISIANLPRMGRDALAALLLSASEPSNLAIIDVRDSGTWI
jgi:hypothetical protein